MNNANPEQSQPRSHGPITTAALSEAVHQVQGMSSNNVAAILSPNPVANPLSDKEKETLILDTIRYVIPQVGMVNGIRYIAMHICDNPASKMAIAENFAILSPNVQPSPFVLEVMKLAIDNIEDAKEQFELFDVWSNFEKANTSRQEALKRYLEQQQHNTPAFFGAMGLINT